jgi:hypothetical protein
MIVGILWKEGVSEGWTDIYSISDFADECKNELYIHPVIAKGERNIFAACLKTVKANIVTLDYRPFPITNEHEDILPGIIKFEVNFKGSEILNFQWIESGSDTIENVIYELTNPTRKPITPQRIFDLLSCENIPQDSPYYLQVKDAFDKYPKIISVNTKVYVRSPVIVKEALKRANGYCEKCGEKSRFNSKVTKKPYLEVHHIKPLSEDGSDTIDNVKAICPNCHREIHSGREGKTRNETLETRLGVIEKNIG